MALFMIQATYTPQAWAAMMKKPENRREAIRSMMEKSEWTLRDVYFCFGEYDVVVLYEAPDAIAGAAAAVAANAAGHLKAIKTTQLLTVEESMDIMRKAAASTLRVPGN
ncbi:MAG: hypothetical protein JWO59_2963 [Chloroflexi bacterium]|nr:hypothetical protein [Chloroflexota bacterium]